MKIGNREFDTAKHTYIMGILNVTPDSFSDGGKWSGLDKALFHTQEMLRDGAAIVDIGGESTRPGYTPISAEEETERVVPVIRAVKERFDIPVSLDTCKSGVALAGLEAGADMINDIRGLKYDGEMAKVIARAGAACCLTHNRETPDYRDYIRDVLADMEETLEIAEKAGIPYQNICLDPGIGFGKTYEQNLEMIKKLDALHTFGLPVLLGASRKSFIGTALDLPVNERLEGTLATTVIAVMKGVSFVRVHDVKENARTVQMAEAVKYAGERQDK